MYKYTKIYSGGVPELKDNGIIKRVGANKNGHWEILK